MDATFHNPETIQITIYGLRPRKTLAELQECAKKVAGQFVPSREALQWLRLWRSRTPLPLGTLEIGPANMLAALAHLAGLTEKRHRELFCCEIKGRPIDFNLPLSKIEQEISRVVSRTGAEPPFLEVTKASYQHSTLSSAEDGPHCLEVTT